MLAFVAGFMLREVMCQQNKMHDEKEALKSVN